jgi:hypothetical protein
MYTMAEFARRLDRLEEESGRFLALASNIDGAQRLICAQLERIEIKLDERPSGVEFDTMRRGLESVRARPRMVPTTPAELELIGPTWLGKAKLSGFSGVTIVAVLMAGLGGLIAWLLLRR